MRSVQYRTYSTSPLTDTAHFRRTPIRISDEVTRNDKSDYGTSAKDRLDLDHVRISEHSVLFSERQAFSSEPRESYTYETGEGSLRREPPKRNLIIGDHNCRADHAPTSRYSVFQHAQMLKTNGFASFPNQSILSLTRRESREEQLLAFVQPAQNPLCIYLNA